MDKTTKPAKEASPYVASVLKTAKVLPGIDAIEDLRPEQLNVLAGGVDAATYLVRSGKGQVIIKISDHDIESEIEALLAWRKRNVRVPEVLAFGDVPKKGRGGKKMKYLVQKALLTRFGRLVETCANYLVAHPEQSRAIGRLLGAELTKMHRAVSPRSFGEYADALGNTAAYSSWNNYMLGYLDLHANYLRSLGITKEEVAQLRTYIEHCRFVRQGRYLHGDFSIRNAAVKSYQPLKVSIFDPNPIVGDPTWDIAVLFNNREYQKRRLEYDDKMQELYDRDRQLLTGFKQGYTRKINERNLWVAQLMQAILQAHYTADKVKEKKLDKVDLRVREEFITDLVHTMIGGRHE